MRLCIAAARFAIEQTPLFPGEKNGVVNGGCARSFPFLNVARRRFVFHSENYRIIAPEWRVQLWK